VLEELASVGLLSPKKATLDRLEAAAHALENLGASGLGARLRELWERLRGQPAPAADAKTGDLAVDAWLDASVRLALVQETPT